MASDKEEKIEEEEKDLPDENESSDEIAQLNEKIAELQKNK